MSTDTEVKFNISFFDGIRKKTLNVGWDELKGSVDFMENKLKFDRKLHIQKKYDTFMRERTDMSEHILKCEMAIDNTHSVGVSGKFVLSKNRFPYDFGTHRHYVLWIHPECDPSIKSRFFTKHGCESEILKLSRKYSDILGDRFIVFRNAAINKSIKNIEHFHVIFY